MTAPVSLGSSLRQIAQFPQPPTALPADTLLLQRYGLGGPYISLSVASVLASALTQVNVDDPTAITAGFGLTYGLPVSWTRNWPTGQPGAGPAYNLTAGSAGRPGFDFNASVWVEGAITAIGAINAAGVYSGGMVVATVNYVTENTCASFNGRIGHVGLTTNDILLAGGVASFDARMQGTCLAPTQWDPAQADDTIATTAFVQRAVGAWLEDWIATQNPVLAFNGRGGNITLLAQDVAQAAAVPTIQPTAPAPIAGQMWFNPTTHAFQVFDGAVWRTVTLT
jgi:hypothetical protein